MERQIGTVDLGYRLATAVSLVGLCYSVDEPLCYSVDEPMDKRERAPTMYLHAGRLRGPRETRAASSPSSASEARSEVR